MRYLLTCCLLLASLSFLSAQGWVKKYPLDTAIVQDLIQVTDSTYTMAINNEAYIGGVTLALLNAKGEVIKRTILATDELDFIPLPTYRPLTKMIKSPDGDFLVIIQTKIGSHIFKLSPSFDIKWSKKLDYSQPAAKFKGNEIVFMGLPNGQAKSTITFFDLNGGKKSEIPLSIVVLDFHVVDDGFFNKRYVECLAQN